VKFHILLDVALYPMVNNYKQFSFCARLFYTYSL